MSTAPTTEVRGTAYSTTLSSSSAPITGRVLAVKPITAAPATSACEASNLLAASTSSNRLTSALSASPAQPATRLALVAGASSAVLTVIEPPSDSVINKTPRQLSGSPS